jgi:DNA modification methylase
MEFIDLVSVVANKPEGSFHVRDVRRASSYVLAPFPASGTTAI